MIIFVRQSYAQNIKFGKVSKQELAEKYYPLDSSANAAILYKKRRTYYDYNDDEGWALITKVHERIKIYNSKGYTWATKKINLYKDTKNERVSIKAYTYNLVNNKIERTKLKSSEIFIENISENWDDKKFTMPNLKKGSIVEWEYTFRSPYFWHIDDVFFQYKIPLKYIDVEIKIPEYFEFKYLPNYYYPVKINKTKKSKTLNFTYRTKDKKISDFGGAGAKTSSHTATIDIFERVYSSIEQNIPAIEDEPFTNNIDNYRSKVSFELIAYRPKYELPKFYNITWSDVTKTIYKSPSFGGQLEKTSYFKNDLQNLVEESASLTEKIVQIFQFVKHKIVWNGLSGKYTLKGVKKAYSEGTGNAAEINLILVAMLRQAGINANPVLISTRENGVPLFPTSKGFNYVIASLEINDGIILLDATEKYSLPNVLPLRDLNWQGRIVKKDGNSSSISLLPQKHAKETCYLNAKISNDGNLQGTERVSYNNLLALQARTAYNGLAKESIISTLEKENDNIEINELKVTNKNDIGKPLLFQFDFQTDNQVEIIGGKIYFSPLFFLAKDENIFKLEDRKFPVDFATPWEEKYTISIKLPEGYTVEAKPESVAYALPENLGSYKFIIAQKGSKLQISSDFKINYPTISPLYYKDLKAFYKKIIDKQLEKVVLTKK
jgi:hypothetical protein